MIDEMDKKTPVNCCRAYPHRHTCDALIPLAALPPDIFAFGHEWAPPRVLNTRRTMKFFEVTLRFIFISDAP
jgi:hypothetical protein